MIDLGAGSVFYVGWCTGWSTASPGLFMSARNFLDCHPERRGRRGDRGVEGTLWPPAIPDLWLCRAATRRFLAAIGRRTLSAVDPPRPRPTLGHHYCCCVCGV